MKNHHDQIEMDIPELGGTMLDGFKKEIKLDTLVTTLRSSAFVVHQTPFIAISGGRGIKADVVIHGNGASPAKPCIRAGRLARANAIGIEWTAKFRILALKISTIGANGNAMVISRFPGVSQIQVDVRSDLIPLTHIVHGHGIMSRIQKK